MTNDPDENKCCEAKISAYSGKDKNAPTRASNLKRHLQRFHPEVLKAVDEKDCTQTKEPVPSSSSQTEEQRTLQPSVARYFVSDKVTVTMTVDTFKKQIIELVVKDSVPISLFSRPAFMCLNGEMARKLDVSLERESIRKLVIEEAFKQKEELKKTLKGRFVFLKMDACTRHRVNYFAINVRFVCDKNEIITKTLAVKDTKAHHTSEFLQVLVEKVLQDYELKKEQVLSVVTDNASNMISTIKLMNESNDGDQQLEEHSGSTDTEMFEIEEHSIVTEEQTEVASDELQHDSLDNLVETVSISVYVDPMHRILLDDQQLSKGKEALFEIAVRMKGLQNSQEEQEEFGRPATSSASSSTDEEFNIEKYLDHKDRAKRSRIEEELSPSKNTASTFQQNFSCALKEIEKFDRSSKITVQQAIPLYPDILIDGLSLFH
ncbi:uncharacterized protein LOC142243755 [Anomaloglossus baeobatrachus]|uniref:uncharacterized protein LOC142243755 n=1 Tax=Anomaloglossus baeobatrachus TaxID=238106 RepID=UPI003F4F7B44